MFRIRLKKKFGSFKLPMQNKKKNIFLEFIIYSNMVDV